jgi:F-type H+-transporting ATPase subunit epsilon
VYRGDQIVNSLFVGGGFAEVTDTRCTVLADDAAPVSDIDPTSVQAEIDRLRGEIEAAESDDERRLVETQLIVAEAKLAATARRAA